MSDAIATKILGVVGRSGAGKSAVSRFVHAAIISNITIGSDEQNLEYLANVSMDEQGRILVDTDESVLSNGKGILDITSRDPDFCAYMADYVWRFVREIPLASRLREFCVDMYGLDWYVLNGSHEDKATLTSYTWNDLPGKPPKGTDPKSYLSHRDFLKHFGEFFRLNSKLLWENRWWEQVQESESELVVTPDIRHDESCIFLKERGAKLIHLLRNPYNDNHSSETGIKNFKDFDLVVDNTDMTLEECHKIVFENLVQWGYLDAE